jgi:hypothetical protein
VGRDKVTPRQAARQSREEKLAVIRAQQAKERRKRNILIGAGGAVAVVLVGALVTVALINDPPVPSAESIEIEGVQEFEDLARNHVTTPVQYEQTPPVGGDHAARWLNCGVYEQPVPNENAVHSLEHGAVWVTYDPARVTADQVSALQEELPDTYTVLSPFEGLSSPVVASAWGAQVALDGADDSRLGDFVTKYWQGPNTPEPGAACTGGMDAPGRVA